MIKDKNTLLNTIDKFEQYLIVDRNYSQNTRQTYVNALMTFHEFSINNDIDLHDMNHENIQKYLQQLQKKGLSSRSINHNISVLRSFYKFLLLEKIVNINPMEHIKTPKTPKTIPNSWTYEEVNQLLDIDLVDKYSYRNRAMIELMYATGLRVSELINLKINDINLYENSIKVLGKGSKRIVPIGDYTKIILIDYIYNYRPLFKNKKESDYLFLNNRGDKLSREQFYKIIKKSLKPPNIKTNFPHTL